MRIRTIKPEFFLHDGLYEAEKETKLPLRIAFIGIWCAADREGRFKWEPRRLGAMILPYDGLDFRLVMDGLLERGFLSRYGPEGQFGCIPSFKEHQYCNLREAQSSIPAPEETKEFTCTHVQARVEGKGMDIGKGKERCTANAVPANFEDFELFWSEIPKDNRIAKGRTREAWTKAIKNGATVEQILGAIDSFKRYERKRRQQNDYRPLHPTTWLNQGRFEDDEVIEQSEESEQPQDSNNQGWIDKSIYG